MGLGFFESEILGSQVLWMLIFGGRSSGFQGQDLFGFSGIFGSNNFSRSSVFGVLKGS